MTVLAIDPGSEQSAWVLYEPHRVISHGIEPNAQLIERFGDSFEAFMASDLVIEQVASYGMPVGRDVFDTVLWCGRFYQGAFDDGWRSIYLLPRRDVKLHLCQSARAKDANVRQALLDRFGGEAVAKGKKAAPGPLYGIGTHCWAALALAVTWVDLYGTPPAPIVWYPCVSCSTEHDVPYCPFAAEIPPETREET